MTRFAFGVKFVSGKLLHKLFQLFPSNGNLSSRYKTCSVINVYKCGIEHWNQFVPTVIDQNL